MSSSGSACFRLAFNSGVAALCGQADYGTLSGLITENGVAIDQISLRHRFGYASQDDILWPVLTARELLTYASSMRIKEPIEARQQRVEKLLTLLGMDKPDVVIGDEHNPGGLSGGQKKRVSIAMELITEPAVLLLDVIVLQVSQKPVEIERPPAFASLWTKTSCLGLGLPMSLNVMLCYSYVIDQWIPD